MLEPINVSLESLNLTTLAPMLIPIVGALLIIVIDTIKGGLDKTLYVVLSMLFILMDLGSLFNASDVFSVSGTMMGAFDVMLIDGLAILSQFIIVGASLLFIPLALTHKRFHEF